MIADTFDTAIGVAVGVFFGVLAVTAFIVTLDGAGKFASRVMDTPTQRQAKDRASIEDDLTCIIKDVEGQQCIVCTRRGYLAVSCIGGKS